MNKEEFKMLSFTDKINYFNNKLREGQTVIILFVVDVVVVLYFSMTLKVKYM